MRKKKEPHRIGVMDIILFFCIGALVVFSIEMIKVFKLIGSVPDTLIISVFGAVTGEFGIMGVIKTAKEKRKQRQEDLEDRKHMEDREDKMRKEAKEDNYGTDRNNQRTEDLELPEEQRTE